MDNIREYVIKLFENENRGYLKIFLGYAPGVGKTYSMLNEANRRLDRGEDVVIGYIEPHGREETLNQIRNIPCIPRKRIPYKTIILEDMDVDAIIKRNPETVIVDELAHTNVYNSKNKKRYEDVLILLSHGINVLTTINIQHMETLKDSVYRVTKVDVKETVPDILIEKADEVVLIDITPDALINRLKRGVIYKKENISRSLNNFFRKGNLTALRELSLMQAAYEVDDDLEAYMKNKRINENWQIAERILVCISSNPASAKLIRHGSRIAKKYKCELYVVYVECTNPFSSKLSEYDKITLKKNKEIATWHGAQIVALKGYSVSNEILKFAHQKHITQLILGHSKRSKMQTVLRGSTINKILKDSDEIEVRIIPC